MFLEKDRIYTYVFDSDFFVYQKSLKQKFKTVLSTKSLFEFVFLRCDFTKGYFLVKTLVSNICINSGIKNIF